MKHPRIASVSLAGIISLLLVLALGAGYAQAQLNHPESVIWDSDGERYLVSSSGNGRIYRMDEEGELVLWVGAGLTSPKGMAIVNSVLYVADVQYIRGFRLEDHIQVMNLYIDEAVALDDLASDGTYLYCSDQSAHRVFRIDPVSEEYTVFVSNGIASPSGLLYDSANNRLLLCSFRANSPIQEIDLAGGNVGMVVNTAYDNLEGLAMDAGGRVYVSCQADDAIYRWTDFADDVETISEDHDDPADITVNRQANFLLVPNHGDNSVDFIDLTLYSEIAPADTLHDFGPVPVDTTVSWELAISNIGDTTLVLTVGRLDTPFCVVNHVPWMEIQPGATDTLLISFTPRADSVARDTLHFTTNDVDEPEVDIHFRGEGFYYGSISLPDTLYDFGTVFTGTDTNTYDLVVENTGRGPLTIDSMYFKVDTVWFGVDDMLATREIPAHSTDTLVVRFAPEEPGEYRDTLRIRSDDPDYQWVEMALAGSGEESGSGNDFSESPPERFRVGRPWPNPFNSIFSTELALPEDGEVTVRVFNTLGRLVDTPLHRNFKAGNHRLRIEPGGWRAGGVYFIQVEVANRGTFLRKAVYLR